MASDEVRWPSPLPMSSAGGGGGGEAVDDQNNVVINGFLGESTASALRCQEKAGNMNHPKIVVLSSEISNSNYNKEIENLLGTSTTTGTEYGVIGDECDSNNKSTSAINLVDLETVIVVSNSDFSNTLSPDPVNEKIKASGSSATTTTSDDLMDMSEEQTNVLLPLRTTAAGTNKVNHSGQVQSGKDYDSFLDFETACTAQDIAKVLETFNAILGDDHHPHPNRSHLLEISNNLNKSATSDSNHADCLEIVDNFVNLMIGEGKPCPPELSALLVNLDDDEEEINATNNGSDVAAQVFSTEEEQDEGLTEMSEQDGEEEEEEYENESTLQEDFEGDYLDTEGYESDRPMVRASMRKLRPVKLLPIPQKPSASVIHEIPSSPTHCESPVATTVVVAGCSSPSAQPPAGFATTLNSPVTNRILVNSLIENVLSQAENSSDNNGGSGSANDNSNNYRTQNHTESRNVLEVINSAYDEMTAPPPYESRSHRTESGTPSNSQDPSSSASRRTQGSTVTPTDSSPSRANSSSSTSSPSRGSLSASLEGSSESSGGRVSSSGDTSSATTNTNNDFYYSNVTNYSRNFVTPSNRATTSGSSSAISSSNPVPAAATDVRDSPERATTRTVETGITTRSSSYQWPHRLSCVLSLIGCTLGLNTISRFSLLSVEYGGNFILQFLFLSLVFGIPLLTFHMSIGQYLSSGIIDMWKISPIFQGIGIALLISQALVGIYTAVGISWVFIYFRDSFITRYEQYRWGRCFPDYRGAACNMSVTNTTNFGESVPDYFNGVVLQRSNIHSSSLSLPTTLKFTVAFNLAVVWMLVFVSLSKGLKSYGKVIQGFVLVPVLTLLVLASKMVGLVPPYDQAGALFGHTAWENFFFNGQTWMIAAREAFFTWGLFGACVMQITSYNRFTHSLKSDVAVVVVITTFVLLLSAFLGNACYSVIRAHNYEYIPSSFESEKTYQFLRIRTPDVNANAQSTPYQNHHISLLMGVRIVTPEVLLSGKSGYQSLRLVTELFPATMALLSHTGLSPFWTVLFYLTCILFGIAQQIAIWHTVIRGAIAIKSKVLENWEITITVCVCATGFVLGLPLCTEAGIFIEYFMDYAIGSGWWIMVLYLLELVAVFIVRGAPYCGENIVSVLITGSNKVMTVLAAMVSFLWNVILPVTLLVLSILSFKNGNMRELYDWKNYGSATWATWMNKEVGSLVQLLPILVVPFVAVLQSCRYLTKGPPDFFSRMQQLYRPPTTPRNGRSSTLPGTVASATETPSQRESEDPPPKYTPPPSYSTATGAKIAKFLRNSIRRSMRLLGTTGGAGNSASNLPPPPTYTTVCLEISAQQQQLQNALSNNNFTLSNMYDSASTSPLDDAILLATTSSSRQNSQVNIKKSFPTVSSIIDSKERSSLRRIASDITPHDIARLLRASIRRNNNNDNNNKNKMNYSSNSSDFTRIGSNSLRAPDGVEQGIEDATRQMHRSQWSSTTDASNSSSYSNSNNKSHKRSRSSGATLMAATTSNLFTSAATESQINLVSHSSSQSDLSSSLVQDNGVATDCPVAAASGIVNEGFHYYLEPSISASAHRFWIHTDGSSDA